MTKDTLGHGGHSPDFRGTRRQRLNSLVPTLRAEVIDLERQLSTARCEREEAEREAEGYRESAEGIEALQDEVTDLRAATARLTQEAKEQDAVVALLLEAVQEVEWTTPNNDDDYEWCIFDCGAEKTMDLGQHNQDCLRQRAIEGAGVAP